MTDPVQRAHSAFRLNLEQQKKQAKDLLKAAKAQDPTALARMSASIADIRGKLQRSELKLADSQFVLARELRFSGWSELKAHILSMDRARAAIQDNRGAPDAEVRTLHVRCGSDIRPTLIDAGFRGDFLEVSYPYCHGPIGMAADHLEQEARYIAEFAGRSMNLSFEDALARRRTEERDLAASAAGYERIVLWMEHDCFDQLVLVRCLAHYAATQAPRILELVEVNHFPGRRADGAPARFLGLGQLPMEAIRLLWSRRRPVTPQQLTLATGTWNALLRDDPRTLAAIMRMGTPALPDLATALHRFLQELPGVHDGSSLTERLVLQILAEGSRTIAQLFALMTYERDPLFFATDLMLLQTIERLQSASQPALSRTSSGDDWQDAVAITETGRAVVRGEVDWMSLQPSPRWVGGVQIRADRVNWRWNEAGRDAVRA